MIYLFFLLCLQELVLESQLFIPTDDSKLDKNSSLMVFFLDPLEIQSIFQAEMLLAIMVDVLMDDVLYWVVEVEG